MGKFGGSVVRAWVLLFGWVLFAPGSLFAIEHEVELLLDLDDDPGTGCVVATVDGPFAGVEQRLLTRVETVGAGTASVIEVTRRVCDPGTLTFGAPIPVDASGWPVGVGLGLDGFPAIETYAPLAALAGPGGAAPGVIRIGVVNRNELGDESTLLTRDGEAGVGALPIEIDLRNVLEIPTLGEWGLVVLVLLLGFSAVLLLGRRGSVALAIVFVLLAAGVASAYGTLDGDPSEFGLSSLLAEDPLAVQDGTAVRALFGFGTAVYLCFRIDASLTFNTAPTADPQAVSTPEDTPVAVTLAGSDPESDPLTFTIVPASGPAHGMLAGAPPNVTYTPDPNYEGPDAFDFRVADPSAATDTATVSITVTGVNDPPAVNAASFSVSEAAAVSTVVGTATFTDPDAGQTHTFAITAGNTGGAFAIGATSGQITVAAALDFETLASYSLTVEVTDDGVPVLSGSATVTVTVTDVDDPPVAVDDAATVTEDDAATAIAVLANDTDVDGGPKAIASVTQPANGTVVPTGGSPGAYTGLTYQPDADYCNDPPGTTPDTFTYSLNGGSTATVAVTVTCADDAPVAVDDAATVTEDDAATAIAVLANDTDIDGGPKAIASVTQPANGTVVPTGGSPGAYTGLTYQPDADYCDDPPGTTPDTFTYSLNGGSTATVSVTVTCADDPPVAVADAATVAEDAGATAIAVLANDTDVDGGPKAIASVTQPTNGTVVPTGGSPGAYTGLTYQPDADYCNDPPGTTPDTFTYTLNGGSSETVSMTVTCVDDDPVAVADAATVAEDAGATAIDVLANDTDIDGGPKAIASVTQPTNGTVVPTGGSPGAYTGLTYQPNADYCNAPPGTTPDTFTYTLNGGSSATVSVTVTCVDDPPVAVADAATVTEDSGASAIDVLANDTDVDGGPKAIASVTQPTNGTVAGTGGSPGAFTGLTYQPNADYCNDGSPVDTFTYTLNGGSSATVSVTVTCVDDPPVAVNDAASVAEDSGATAIDVLANDTDVDGGPKAIASVTQPMNGTVVPSGGSPGAYTGLTYEPNPNYCNDGSPVDPFTYTLNGGSSATVSVTVTCVDDPPVAVADAATVVEDSGANAIDVLANDTDVDGGPKMVALVQSPSANGATVLITGGGTGVSYAPAANYCNAPPGTTPDTFTYTLNGGSSTTVSVTVTCVNDPPVAGDDSFDFVGNTELFVDLAAPATAHALETTGSGFGLLDNDADPVEGDAIAISSITAGACTDSSAPFDCTVAGFGTVHVEANGRFSFRPAPGDVDATESFTYVLSDDGLPSPASAMGTVTLTRFGRVWYVDNSAVAGGLGRSHDPFDTLVEAQTASSVNDYIFVHFGDGTATGQDAGITLKSGQHLLGEHVGLSLPVSLNGNGSPTVLFAAVPGNRSVLGDTVAAGPEGVSAIDAIPAEVAGLSLSGNVNAIEWTTNAAFAGGGTTFDVHDNVVTGAGAIGVDVNLAGTGATRLSFHDNSLNATSTALNVQETGSGALTITGFANNSVNGNTGGSAMVINNAIFDATPGGGFDLVPGGTTAIGASGNGVGGAGLVMTGVSGDLLFTDLDVFADGGGGALAVTGTGASNLGGGTGLRFRVGAGVGTMVATAGPAVSLSNLTADLQLASLTSTGSSTTGVSLSSVSDGGGTDAVFSAGSGSAITLPVGAAGPAFSVSGGNEKLTYAGTITNNATAASAVSISGWAGDDSTDDLLLSGAIDENGAGIRVQNNAGARAITFSGGLDIDTTGSTAEGFAATSNTNTLGLNVTGSANDIDSVSATALRVTNTPIGSSHLSFRHVSSGNSTGAADPASGIVIDTTGSAGSLKITGTGSAGSGGTIQFTTSHAISLTNTLAPQLAWMNVHDIGRNGIDGQQVTSFTLSNSTISDVGTAAAGQYDESNIAFNDGGAFTASSLSGTVSITNNTLTNARRHGIDIENGTGTIGSLTISNNVLTSATSAAQSLGNGILILTQGSAATTAHLTTGSISGNTITNFPSGAGILIGGGSGSSTNTTSATLGANGTPIDITGNFISGQSSGNRLGTNAIQVSFNGQNGVSNFNISGNGTVGSPLTNFAGIGITVFMGGTVTGTTTINDNVLVSNNTAASSGIAVQADDGPAGAATSAANVNVTINNNSVSSNDGFGIRAIARASLATMDVTIQNNTVAAPSTANRNGIRVDSGSGTGDTTLCLAISGNTSAGSGVNQGIALRKQGTTATVNDFGIVGLSPSPTTGANAAARVATDNPAGSGVDIVSGDNFVSCTITP